jgi:hypothetical protein
MLNLLRKVFRPTLREQLEEGVREALRRYADRRNAPDLRVFVTTDLLPEGVDHALWARDEGDHLRHFASRWAEDQSISRAGLRVEIVLLETKREFAFVKPLGLEEEEARRGGAGRALVEKPPSPTPTAGGGTTAVLEVLEGEAPPLRVSDEVVLGRRSEPGVTGTGDRYMSGRHARFRVSDGRLRVTDLDSRNRTYLNDHPLPPHQETVVSVGDVLRLGGTTYHLARLE